MDINLFDSNFENSACSVAWETPEKLTYTKRQMSYPGITLFTDAWMTNPVVSKVTSPYKFGWLHEPGCLWPELYHALTTPLFRDRLDHLLTYRKDLCDLPGNMFTPYGGTWIPRSQRFIHQKTKLVSMLYGDKRLTTGHQMRHLIGNLLPASQIDYFGFQGEKVNYSQETKVKVLAPYMFSIVVETCREDWLFTEILLDCFMVGTIPIFWGCPGISKFFDARGILSFSSIPELRAIIDALSVEQYVGLFPYARRNFELAQPYAVTEDWMAENIFSNFI